MNQKRAGVLLSYANISVTIVANLLYTPIMLRMLGPNEYGIYNLSSSMIGYLSLLYAGMTSTYLRYYARYHRHGDAKSVARLNGLFLVLFGALGIVALVLGIFFSFHLEAFLGTELTTEEYALARVLFIIFAVNMAVLMPKTVFATMVIAQERFVFIKSLDVLRGVLTPLLGLPLLFYGLGSVGLSMVTLVLTACDLTWNIWYCLCRIRCQIAFRSLPLSLLPGMAAFSFFIVLQTVMDQLHWQIGKFVLANFMGSAAVAVFAVGVQFNGLVVNFSTVFRGVVVPEIYALAQRKAYKEMDALFLRVGRYQFYVVYLIWLGFAFFGRPFIRLWAGEAYDATWFIAMILITPIVLHLTQSLGVEIVRAYNKHAVWVLVHLGCAVLGFAVSIPLVRAYGVMGAAFGTAISTFLATVLFDNVYYQRVIGLDMFAFYRGMAPLIPSMVITAGIAVGCAKVMVITGWLSLAAACGFFFVCYSIVMYYLGMNAHEKALVQKAVGKLHMMFQRR